MLADVKKVYNFKRFLNAIAGLIVYFWMTTETRTTLTYEE